MCPSCQEGSLGLSPICASKANLFTKKERGLYALQQPHRSHHSDVRRHQLPFPKNKCPYGEGVLQYVVLFDTTGIMTLLGLFDGSLPYLAPAPRTFRGSPLSQGHQDKCALHAVLCCVRFAFCCALLCCAVLCRALLCSVVLCCASLCCVVLGCFVLCCARCAVLCCAVRTVRYRATRDYVILYSQEWCTKRRCIVLCCALLCCAAPCSIMNVTFGRDRSLGKVAVLLSEWFESFLRLDCDNFRVITDGET